MKYTFPDKFEASDPQSVAFVLWGAGQSQIYNGCGDGRNEALERQRFFRSGFSQLVDALNFLLDPFISPRHRISPSPRLFFSANPN